ncbi:hypothetical protein VPHF99_0259 [Vibrio phage F99]
MNTFARVYCNLSKYYVYLVLYVYISYISMHV